MRFCLLVFAFLLAVSNLSGQKKKELHLYDIANIIEVRVYFEESDWEDILDSLKQEGNDDRLLGDAVINGVKYEQAGVRYKGNSSYFNVRNDGSSKLPLNIKVNENIKGVKLPGGYTSLKLSNSFRDPSFLREVLAYEIAGKYMPSPRANFAKVFVNDRYLGLYHSSESVEDEFLDQYYGDHKGTLIKCDPYWHAELPPGCPEGDKASLMYLGEDPVCYKGSYEMKSDSGWKDLIELTRILNKEPNKIEQILDVDQVLWMLAFNNLTVNLDSYAGRLSHNYYLYRDSFGIFHPIVWDMNLCFGGFRYSGLGNPLSNEAMQNLSPLLHYREKNLKRPLITNLLHDGLYRKIYIAHMRTILMENFAEDAFMKRAREIHKIIDPLVKEDENKLYSYEDFRKNLAETTQAGGAAIIGLEELMKPRTEYLLAHPLILAEQPVISDVRHIDHGEKIAVQARIAGAGKAWLMYRYGPFGPFQRLEMLDDGKSFSASIENKDNIQYYLIAEGERAAALSPERASFEFYEVNGEQP
jgi:hypothetical protein